MATVTHPLSMVLSHWLIYATLAWSALEGITVKKLFFCWGESPLGMMLGQTVMKALFPLLEVDLI